jgi:hypothetical protein
MLKVQVLNSTIYEMACTNFYRATNIVVSLPNSNGTGDFRENFVNILAPQSAISNVFVDNRLVGSTNFIAVGSGYYGTRITFTNIGPHSITSPKAIGTEVYGWGVDDAYGYFGSPQ